MNDNNNFWFWTYGIVALLNRNRETKPELSPEEQTRRAEAAAVEYAERDAAITEYLNEVTVAWAILIVIAALLFFTVAL